MNGRGDDVRTAEDKSRPDGLAIDARFSLRTLFVHFRGRLSRTCLLVVLEAALMLSFPLLIGSAIDGLLRQSYGNLFLLGGTGVAMTIVGSVRRLYDTRVYSAMHAAAGERIVRRERGRDTNVSALSARTNMVSELVEFLETSLPGLVDCVIGLVGALVMIWFLQKSVFASCLVATVLVVAIHAATGKTTYALNKGVNDETEGLVDVLSENGISDVASHFERMMRWRIRLSDVETINFAASWLVMVGVLTFSVAATVRGGATEHGRVLAILMYVFGYVESVAAAPMFYQQFLRIREITDRLAGNA